MRYKAIAIDNYVVSQGINVLAVIETCLRTNTDQLTINQLIPTDYKLILFIVKVSIHGCDIPILSGTSDMYAPP